MSDATTVLFGLPGVRVDDVVHDDGGGRVVHVRTDDDAAAFCPVCGEHSTTVRQYRTTRPRDLPYGAEPLAVRWRKRQYACLAAHCPRKAFTEAIGQVPARARITGRLREHVAGLVDAGLPVSVACEGLMTWPVAHAAFVTAVSADLQAPPGPVEVLGIDETRRGRLRVTRDPDTGEKVITDRFETNFVDLAGDQGLLGQSAGRTKASVTTWLGTQDPAWRVGVRYVAIDPHAGYRAAITEQLPDAVIVADHFHLVRLANQAVTDVRRRVTWDNRGRRGRKVDPEWASRRRLLRARERQSAAQFARMWNDTLDGDPTGQILRAWIGKEELRALLATVRTGGQRHDVAHRLTRFYAWCADSDLPELHRLASTVAAWWPEILAFVQSGLTNAGTESTNRTIKTTTRNAYGFRNLTNQRRRVRCACTRRTRRNTSTRGPIPPQL